jgi:hypothetical protein
MNIKEAQKLASRIANYLCEIVSYESPEDINIDIVNDPALDSTGNTKRLPRYMVSLVTINLAQLDDSEFVSVLCHELAHVFLGEYIEFYETWIGFSDNHEKDPQYKTFVRAEERTAMRVGKFLERIWNSKEKK